MEEKSSNKTRLDHAIRVLRPRISAQAEREEFSAGSRQLLTESFQSCAVGSSSVSFAQRWQTFALLGVAVLLALVVLPNSLDTDILGDADSQTPRIHVSKVDGRVVFHLQNGVREHTVTRSTDPGLLEQNRERSLENGTFSDRLDQGPDLLFYRID